MSKEESIEIDGITYTATSRDFKPGDIDISATYDPWAMERRAMEVWGYTPEEIEERLILESQIHKLCHKVNKRLGKEVE